MCAVAHRHVLTAVILAGGKASRMKGRYKALLKIGKDRLIDLQLGVLKKIFKEIIIVTNSPERYRDLKGVKLVPDVVLDIGPLAGIYSGLLSSKSSYNFVLACDMPYINLDLIKYMLSKTDGFDAVVPKINNRYEPLFAIYSKNCLKIIKGLLDRKIFKIRRLFSEIKLKAIRKKEILNFDSPEHLFMNINTKGDLTKIKQIKRAL